MHEIMIDASWGEIMAQATEMLTDVQGRSRQRLCSPPEADGHWCRDWSEHPEGCRERDGGGVANCYGYRAGSTRLGLAWWTDGLGRRHTRLEVDRLGISGRHVSCIWSANRRWTAWERVYRDRAETLRRRLYERTQRRLSRLGSRGEDDRVSIVSPILLAEGPEGVLIADRAVRPHVVQVVVRDATTGQRHHLAVPPKFGPGSRTWERLGSAAARVHAAIAWTFRRAPEAYAPAVAS